MLQEEVAEENEQKIEAERQIVHEAKIEFDKLRKMSEDTDSKYSSVREQIDQLSEYMEPLKVQHSVVLSRCCSRWSKNSFINQKSVDYISLLLLAGFCGFDATFICSTLNVCGV